MNTRVKFSNPFNLLILHRNFVKKIHARNLANNSSRHIWGILTGISLCIQAKLICIRFKRSNALTSNVIYEHDYSTTKKFCGIIIRRNICISCRIITCIRYKEELLFRSNRRYAIWQFNLYIKKQYMMLHKYKYITIWI